MEETGFKSFAQMGRELQSLADRTPQASTVTGYASLGMSYDVEERMAALVSMLRLNGGQVLFRREIKGEQVFWTNFRVCGSAFAAAWFFQEADAIGGWDDFPVSNL